MMPEEAQGLEGEQMGPIETEATTTAPYRELIDSTGRRILVYQSGAKIIAAEDYGATRARAVYAQDSLASEEEVVVLEIPRKEFERLSVKTNEVLAEAAFAQERIGKDQQEIEELKRETRAMLAALRAA